VGSGREWEDGRGVGMGREWEDGSGVGTCVIRKSERVNACKSIACKFLLFCLNAW
jgi:hypothetical protein